MLPALTGPVLAAAVLLALAAPGKLRRPADTVRALRSLGLPGSAPLVRALGAGELVLAVAVWLAPSRPVLALLALAYASFAVFVAAALRRRTPLQSCGCFGRPDTPPTAVHLGVVTATALACAAAAVTGSAGLVDVLGAGATGLALLLATAVVVGLAWAALAVLPQVAAARTPPARTFAVVPS